MEVNPSHQTAVFVIVIMCRVWRSRNNWMA